MTTSFAVRFWAIKVVKGRRRPYGVRWVVGGREHSDWFVTRALADSHRSQLMQAARRGEPFDTDTGLPESTRRAQESRTLLDFAQGYMAMKWPRASANSRRSAVDALATVVAGFVVDRPGRPPAPALRRAVVEALLPPDHRSCDLGREQRNAADWLRSASRPLAELAAPAETRRVLDHLAVTLDGLPAAATTINRKRAVLHNLLAHAVEQEAIPDNPLHRVRWSPPKVADQVDPRVVVNPVQVRELLTAVTYVGQRDADRGGRLVAFFGALYFAALRPAEALGLREQDCDLPASGWGALTLVQSRPTAGKQFTDAGETHDRRGLKHRARKDVRVVPVPPELVEHLRRHLARWEAAPDGRLFVSRSGSVVGSGTYAGVWAAARQLGLPPALAASPVAARPYDLRHAAVSLWLNAGVPATEVAERAGHSVEVLLKVYAKCIDGQRATINTKIDGVLG